MICSCTTHAGFTSYPVSSIDSSIDADTDAATDAQCRQGLGFILCKGQVVIHVHFFLDQALKIQNAEKNQNIYFTIHTINQEILTNTELIFI